MKTETAQPGALFQDPLSVINIGLASFAESLRAQQVAVTDVD